MSVGSMRHGRRLVVILHGDIDMATAPGMLAAIDKLLDAQVPGRLVVSIEHVTFMDSSGLALLDALSSAGEDAGFGVVLMGVSQRHRRLLDAARMSGRFAYRP